MKNIWQATAIGTMGAAALHWLGIGGQIVHAIVLTLKIGWSAPVLTAGTGMLKMFLALTGLAAAACARFARVDARR